MIKKNILKILKKLIIFLNNRLKIKSQPHSPAELYFKDVAQESYEKFKIHFKNSFVFSDDNSIRNFAINEMGGNQSAEKHTIGTEKCPHEHFFVWNTRTGYRFVMLEGVGACVAHKI